MRENRSDHSQFDRHADHIRVPLHRKLAYAVGVVGPNAINGMTFQYAKIFYNRNLGINSVLVGNAWVIIQLIDALNDIILGQVSDNTRTRWGRRRPYLLFGGIACSFLYLFIWMPPASFSPILMVIFLALMVGLADTAYTLITVPHAALGAEMSYDYHERTRVMSFRTAGFSLGSIGGSGAFYMATLLSGPGSTEANQRGFVLTAAIFGAIALGCCVITFLGTREEAALQAQPKIRILDAFKYCFRNRNYVILMVSSFIVYTGFMTGIPIENYLWLFHVAQGNDELAGKLYLISQILAVLGTFVFGLPFMNWISKRFGKKVGMIMCMVFVGTYIFTAIPLLTPEHPWMRVFFVATYVWGIEGMIHVFVGAMTADLCDIDELMSGRRREGMYMSLLPLVIKVGGALGIFFWGILLQWAGFQEGASTQSTETIQKLFTAMVIPTFLGAIVGTLILLKYNVTETMIHDVRRQLDARRNGGGEA